jgi:toxin FitB
MKRYLLDTNVVSELRRRTPHGAVVAWYSGVPDDDVFIPAIVIGELQAGIERTREVDPLKADEIEQWLEQLLGTSQILSLNAEVLREWARLMHRRSSELLQDALVAAAARVHGLTVATRNERDFLQFGVEIFNPFKN